MAFIPAMRRNANRRVAVQASPCIKQDPISKITNTKKGCGRVPA
jgi:hypothetical protein